MSILDKNEKGERRDKKGPMSKQQSLSRGLNVISLGTLGPLAVVVRDSEQPSHMDLLPSLTSIPKAKVY